MFNGVWSETFQRPILNSMEYGVKLFKDHSVFKIGVVTPIGSEESKRYHELHGKCCAFCGDSNSKLFKCSECKNVLYCGRLCQKSDWKMHKLVCSASPLLWSPPSKALSPLKIRKFRSASSK